MDFVREHGFSLSKERKTRVLNWRRGIRSPWKRVRLPQLYFAYVTTQGGVLPGSSPLHFTALGALINSSQGMVHLPLRRTWKGSIRLALTLLGLPYTVCNIGIRSAISCSPSHPFRSKNIGPISSSCLNFYMTSVWKMPSSVAVPHVKSRCPQYPGSTIKRFPVPDDKVDWSQDWPQYHPVSYTAPSVLNKPAWADPDIGSFSPQFNAVDGVVDRKSFEGSYRVENGKPLNPLGRTGLTGRGLLGRWGPNHAADPIVTRWKVDPSGAKMHHPVSKNPVLQFVSIKRKDCGEWAIPGGMVDAGEQVSLTLQREFSEEALNSLSFSPSERAELHARITKLFESPGFQVYKGYVDDPRNTDNAWMETVAVNFHDEQGNSVSELPLQAGDDAGQVQWADIDSSLALYASHSLFLELVAKERKAHW
ncbi:ADP-ribose pyrophosphatase, mitochondrial [Melanotaenia boesemani]|uniref:ADP-ribose pyrophosphatase, mitochondrial n=1 Tax=Melanotaenia boesemani TaxID=1250792 RepID=UPI001C051635|nr:ADP-ribose pyrophosphatase, mitochondrial [Melanotaenia boesemani]